MFKALKYRNYQLYFTGQMISLTGSSLQSVALAWMLFRITNSAEFLGLNAFAYHFPAFILSPLAGSILDRWDRRTILLITTVAQMIQAFVLGVLAFYGLATPWTLIALTALLGVTVAFEVAARNTLAIELVGKKDLQSAISINSSLLQITRVGGPAIAAIILNRYDETVCFFLNGASFLAITFCLFLITTTPSRKPTKRELGFKKVFAEIRNKPRIQFSLGMATILGLIAHPYTILLPAMATGLLQGNAQTFASLATINAIGSIIGIMTSQWFAKIQLEKIMLWRCLLTGSSLGLLSYAQTFPVAAIAIGLTGFFLIPAFPLVNHAIQLDANESFRGRLTSIYGMSYLGSIPVGSLILSSASDRWGIDTVCRAMAIMCLIVSVMVLPWLRKAKRQTAASSNAA